ncbi:MAG: hypothetical protein SVX28_04145 [Pseudomonadota bacterium]|nr:hypothetical protein [Pseudomonadota bacterium]
MRVVQRPVMLWLMDEILNALLDGPVLRQDLYDRVGAAPDPGTLGRHVYLLADLGLLEIDYRFDEPFNRGRSDRAVVELVEVQP